jgi:hypothetical protein
VLRWLLPLIAVVLVGCGAPAASHDDVAGAPAPAAKSVSGILPTAIRIPSLGVDSHDPWAALGLQPSGEVEVPSVHQPATPGWYCPSGVGAGCGAPVPGETGPAVVLAHIDGDHKPGLFYKLAQLKVGAQVEIDRADDQTAVFRITRVQTLDKDDFPSQSVYGNTKGPEIRLISCGGRYDAANKRFLDQIIAWGQLTELRPKA